MPNKLIIGKEEWCELPELNLPAVKARIDSGAKTSSLHAFNIQYIEEDGISYIHFDIHPVQNNRKITKRCKAIALERRDVKSSSGDSERRHVIKTPITIGEQTWEIEVTLSNRDSMGYRMLIGREAMANRVLIDPEASFSLGDMKESEVTSLYPLSKKSSNTLSILLLASNPKLYSNRRIIEAAEDRGHKVRFINVRHCYMNISADGPAIYYRGNEPLNDIDVVIPRIRPDVTFYGCAVARQFESMGVFCLNNSVSISRSRDKLRCLQMLSRAHIDMPVTGFANSPTDTKSLIGAIKGTPLIIKLLSGTQGKGVVLAETKKAAESVINAFKSLKADILVQEFIKEAEGSDIRCFVVDGKVVGAMERRAAEGEFRSNLHLGASSHPVKITPAERKMAVKAAKVMGLHVAGVDIIRSNNGSKVLEVNSSPGLQGIEKVTGKDIASLMIQCAEKHVGVSVEKAKKKKRQ